MNDTVTTTSSFHALYKKIGYAFSDEALLIVALTHPSVNGSTKNNQRLEFLGDAALSCIITETLFERFPSKREGLLTCFRSLLVCQKSLVELARTFALGDYLKLGDWEREKYPNGSDAMLADALEALIAAIYLDSNMIRCKQVVNGWFEEKITQMPMEETQAKGPKTRLQEHLQKAKLPLPVYKTSQQSSLKHAQQYIATCLIYGEKSFEGHGSSKRQAEQAAASAALNYIDAL